MTRTDKPSEWRRGLWMAPLIVLPFVAACSDDDDDDDSPDPVAAGPVADGYLLSANEATVAGTLSSVTPALATDATFLVGGNQGVVYDRIGNVYHADDGAAPGSVFVFSHLFDRDSGDAFDASRDRVLGGTGTTLPGLVNAKSVHVAQTLGLLLVADFGDGDVKVFGSAAGADAPPVATVTVAAAPWDLDYDEASDRLFVALTNGEIAVFDAFSVDLGAGGVDRTIVPADATPVKISDNLHGIEYSAATDALVVSDVGAATDPAVGFESDGSLYVFADASTADGLTIPTRMVEGPTTLLGDPVDIAFSGTAVVVAEKSTDQVLVFNNILTATVVDRAPTNAVAHENPQALVARLALPALGEEVSDIDSTATALSGLVAVSNPTAIPFGGLSGFDTDLTAEATTFNANDAAAPDEVAGESLVFDRNGDGYLSINDVADIDGDPTTTGGILVIGRLANQRDGDDFDPARDRFIMGPAVGLVSPKGLDVTATGELIVADSNGEIVVLSTQADGDAAPLFEVTDMGDPAREPWAVDYDPAADRLYVACSDGTVAVWDDFLTEGLAIGGSTLTTPDRVIIPNDALAAAVSTNLRGIVHDTATDTLYLADVGPTLGAVEDGKLLVITDASTADGATTVAAELVGAGALNTLADPSGLAWDGANLYVADQGSGEILRWDAFETISGEDLDLGPDASIAMASVDSVALLPSTLAP